MSPLSRRGFLGLTAAGVGSAAVGAGYDRVRDGMLEPWLYARMGALLAQHGPT